MLPRANIVKALRSSVARIDGTRERFSDESRKAFLRFGINEIDTLLEQGLTLDEMHEVRCSLSRDIGCTTGFLLGLLSSLNDKRPIVWLGDPSSMFDRGNLFPDGLMHFGIDVSRLVHIQPMHLSDCLWATGEAVRSSGLAAIVLQIKGNPKTFDLSVSRKLMLRAQKSGTPLFILRQAGEEEASSAATRWHVSPAPSSPNEIYPKGLGHMRLTLTLEKNRNGRTGQWLIAWNPQTRSFEHAADSSKLWTSPTAKSSKLRTSPTPDSTAGVPQSTHSSLPLHPFANRPDKPAAMGQVMADAWTGKRAS